MLVLALLQGWAMRQLNFVLAYPQANIKADIFMELPQGFRKGGLHKTHCLQLLKNLYRGKNLGRLWYLHLVKGLRSIGFRPSLVDDCLFYGNQTAILVYVDNCIVVAWTKAEIDNVVKELKNANFDVTDKGNTCNYLGVRVDKRADGTLRLTQPHLILSILEDLQLGEGSKPCVSPAANTVLLHKHLDALPHTERWDYCSVVGS